MFGQSQNIYTNKYDDKKGFSVDNLVKIIEAIKKIQKVFPKVLHFINK